MCPGLRLRLACHQLPAFLDQGDLSGPFSADPQWSSISAWCPQPPPHPHPLTCPPPPTSPQSTMRWGRGAPGKERCLVRLPHSCLGRDACGSWGWCRGNLQSVDFAHMHHSPRSGPLLPASICVRGFPMPDLTLHSKLKTAWQIKKEIVVERKQLCTLVPLTATFAAFWTFSSCSGLHQLSSQSPPSSFWCSVALFVPAGSFWSTSLPGYFDASQSPIDPHLPLFLSCSPLNPSS